MKINLEDPRLSAYALNEMDPEERREFEALLANDPEAQAEVDQIKALAGMLESELRDEPVPEMSEQQRDSVIAAADTNVVAFPKRGRRILVGLAKIAAGLLVIAAGFYLLMPSLVQTSDRGRFDVSRGENQPAPPAISAETVRQLKAVGYLSGGNRQSEAKAEVSAPPPPSAEPTRVSATPASPAPKESKVEASAPPAPRAVDEAIQAKPEPEPKQKASESRSAPPAPAAPAPAPAKEEMEPLQVQLPKPMFVGTPKSLGPTRPLNAPPAPAPAASAPSSELKNDSGSSAAASRAYIESSKMLPDESGPTGIKPYRIVAPPAPAAPAPAEKGGLQNVAAGGEIRLRGRYYDSASPAPGVSSDALYLGSAWSVGAPEAGVYIAPQPPTAPPGTESYKPVVENEFKMAKDEPLSTFSIDVDTASYTNVRRFLNDGALPPADAVRIEELINYFKYDYPEPEKGSPFSINVEAHPCPWNPEHSLALIGLRGKSVAVEDRAPVNLVFLLDVSGSMEPENKLPLLKKGMRLMVDSLTEKDRVGIVTYASVTGVALPSTNAADKAQIRSMLDVLRAGGCTNGAGGIQLAYQMAAENFIKGGINRIVLATDGDFNVGISDTNQLTQFIQEKARTGVFLSVLGFGEGNLQDDKLEALADKGNGHYAYIDSFKEARRVLLDDVAGTMVPIAKDVKIQVEFNPAKVGAYRLVGYENRVMAAQDFNDDRKDAGEIGSGHTVTALYELVGPDKVAGLGGVDLLKYQSQPKPESEPVTTASNELMTVKLRYKHPDANKSTRFDVPVLAETEGDLSGNFKFASSVAMFGMLLRNSQNRGSATYDSALALAQEAKGFDSDGNRSEFLSLIQTARALAGPVTPLIEDRPQMAKAETSPAPGVPAEVSVAPVSDSVPLDIRLPKPMFAGTPKNIVSANLETPTGKPRPPFMVPKGTHSLSEGMPVTASDMQPIMGEVEMITDGDKEGADGSFVEFGPGVQWVQVDLQQPYNLYAILVWHFHSQARVYRDFIVQVSNDPDFVKDVVTLFNNDHDNSAGLGIGADKEYIETAEGRLVDAKGVQARYVRLYSSGNTSNDLNHMLEVEVFGK